VDETLNVYPGFSPPQLTPAGLTSEEDGIVRQIESAHESVEVCVMTYSTASPAGPPYLVLDRALRAAANRGVSVKLMVANWSTARPNIEALRSLARVPHVEIKVTTIPAYSKGFIPYSRVDHSKYMVVDRRLAWVGTSNWECGYFHQCRDVSLFFDGALINRQLRRGFDFEWNGPYAAPLELDRDYPPVKTS
jgi:phosphatidylserine/phosphatidylglycerophosphate/cardiolipin synthase-like enzyme